MVKLVDNHVKRRPYVVVFQNCQHSLTSAAFSGVRPRHPAGDPALVIRVGDLVEIRPVDPVFRCPRAAATGAALGRKDDREHFTRAAGDGDCNADRRRLAQPVTYCRGGRTPDP